ncbi:hypothetical protein LTR96_006464 [Exophiala xenobiotica]|nr:hypothetical protein LTR96_006464 [Exophiala xenobiotica]KAK5335655.1 hypothetical protein LTR98_007869 [Exophiala xenobiotica]
MGATCPQNAVVDFEEPEDRNLEDTGREQIFGDHGKFVEDEVGDQDKLPSLRQIEMQSEMTYIPSFLEDKYRHGSDGFVEARNEGFYQVESVPARRKPAPHQEDVALQSHKCSRAADDSPAHSENESTPLGRFRCRLGVCFDREESDLDDDSLVGDDDDDMNIEDIEGSEPESKYSIEGDEDYVDDGESLSDVLSGGSEKSREGKDQNASCQGQSRAPLDYRGIDRPRLRRPVLAITTPQPTSTSEEPESEVDEADEENTRETGPSTEDVKTIELDIEKHQCLHANDESTTAPKVAKVSEKVKVAPGKLGQLLDKRHCNASAAIANMRFTGKYFEDEDDVNEFWARYWSLLRAASGVDQDDVGPNLTCRRRFSSSTKTNISRHGSSLKEQESGVIRSADGKHQYQTMPTLGGIVCDIPGGGKTLMSIMHHQNIINRMPLAGGVYMPSMYIVPKSAIGQCQTSGNLDWMAANVSTKDLEKGPENVPERLKFAFDTTDRRAASVAFLVTTQTCEIRFKDPSPWVGRFARCFIDEAHGIKDPDTSISKVVRGFRFRYRHLITATTMIDDKSDIMGLADLLVFFIRGKRLSRYQMLLGTSLWFDEGTSDFEIGGGVQEGQGNSSNSLLYRIDDVRPMPKKTSSSPTPFLTGESPFFISSATLIFLAYI